MIGEVDIFYPLQTKASDWYQPTSTPGPPPDEDYDEDDGDDDGDDGGGVAGSNTGVAPAGNAGGFPGSVGGTKSVSPAPLLNDPNFGAPNHPGEIYVGDKPGRRKSDHSGSQIKRYRNASAWPARKDVFYFERVCCGGGFWLE